MFDVSATLSPVKSETSLGSRLGRLREEKGLPLEQAAHETRIRVQRLREIESNDLSHFSHPSYARLFLVDYAKYLGLSMEEIRHLLPAPGACGSEGYQYLQDEIPQAVHRVRRAPRPRRVARAVTVSALVLLLLFVGIRGIVFLQNINRLNLNEVAQGTARPNVSAEMAEGDRAAIAQPDNPPPAAESAPAESAPAPAENAEAKPAPADDSAAPPPTADENTFTVPLYVGGALNRGNAVQ